MLPQWQSEDIMGVEASMFREDVGYCECEHGLKSRLRTSQPAMNLSLSWT